MKAEGKVYLVGAGPGDVGLMTLRGAELLGIADIVVYDALVNPDVLRLAPATAQIVFAGKRAGDHSISQDELNQMLVAKAREGKIVVRLKGGDPYVFGRGGEEAQELAEAKIGFEVVPGISSFVAVPSYAGIPLTHRDFSSRITLITGHEDPATEDLKIDWQQLATTPGTKVIMMGTDRVGHIAEVLVRHGMPHSTPVAMVRWGTTGRQRSVQGTLADIGAVARKAAITAPTVIVIGDVISLREKLNWFEKRPLFGRRVAVTRSRDQAGRLSRALRDLGAEVLEVPTIKLEPPTRRQDVIDAILELNSYDWLIFTSPNGVTQFFEYFFRHFHDLRDLGGARIAAVGPATAAKLRELHLQVDLMPEEALATSIGKAFAKYESIENLKICLLRAEVANRDLPEQLEALGAIVDDVACYRTVPETEDPGGAAAALAEHGADWITFTSGSTVENFNQRFGLAEFLRKFPGTKIASIGPETSKALKSLGVVPTIEARDHTIEGLVNSIAKVVLPSSSR